MLLKLKKVQFRPFARKALLINRRKQYQHGQNQSFNHNFRMNNMRVFSLI